MINKLATVLAVGTFLGVTNIQATLLGPDDWPSTSGNPDEEAENVEGWYSLTPDSLFPLAKFEIDDFDFEDGAGELNPATDYFTVAASTTPGFYEISWDLTGSGYQLDYVYWKGGQGTLVYPVSQVVGDDQRFNSITPQLVPAQTDEQRGLSHLTFLGTEPEDRPPGGAVPDGGLTLALLGLGLGAVEGVRRRIVRK